MEEALNLSSDRLLDDDYNGEKCFNHGRFIYLLKLLLCKTRSDVRVYVSLADGSLWSTMSRIPDDVALLTSNETNRVCRSFSVNDLTF